MTKLAFGLSFLIMLPLSVVFADTSLRTGGELKAENTIQVQARSTDDQNQEDGTLTASSSITAETGDDRSATGSRSEERAEASANTDDEASSTGRSMSAEHRSAVASFVQSLLADSERDGGIGAEVRAVAESQNESASTTAEAIAKVESRSKIWTVLFGTDWKNIGMLRSQIAKTDSDAARLERALSQTPDSSVKADLAAQLTALKTEQAKVTAFVESHEKAFSLFGWFTKLFVGANTSTTATTTAASS
jgi:hypothetical protein